MIIPFSQKLDNMQEYFFARANTLIAQVEAEGERKVVNLGIGSPDLPPQPVVLERLKQEIDDPLNHRYPGYRGEKVLRDALAAYYWRRFGVELDPEKEVLPLIGSKEGLVNICLAFLNPGDAVLVPNPGYPAYTAGPILANGVIQTYTLKADNNWLPDMAELEALDLSKTKLWWLGYPNNPTGAVASQAEMEKWVAFAKKHKLLLLFDNPYADTYYGEEKPLSILEISGAKEVAIEFNSLSKTFNLAGWRIGMAVGSAEYIQPLLTVKSNIDTGIFMALQKAAAFALNETSEAWQQERREIYRQRRDIVCAALQAMGFTFETPQAALYVWAQVPGLTGSVEAFSFEVIRTSQVFVTPGTAFGSAGEGWVRISLCQSLEQIEEGMKRLQGFFENQK